MPYIYVKLLATSLALWISIEPRKSMITFLEINMFLVFKNNNKSFSSNFKTKEKEFLDLRIKFCFPYIIVEAKDKHQKTLKSWNMDGYLYKFSNGFLLYKLGVQVLLTRKVACYKA